MAYQIENNYAQQHDKVSADSCTIQQQQEWLIKSNRERQNAKVKAGVLIFQKDWFRSENSQRQNAMVLDCSHIFLQDWFQENSNKRQLELWDRCEKPLQLHAAKKLKARGVEVNEGDDTFHM